MKRKPKLFYIKERHNPQLGVYYVALGQLSRAEAAAHERSLYGHNVVLGFAVEADYLARLEQLKAAKESVQ